jgi:uncharacterized membrane protein (UPF0127 family)
MLNYVILGTYQLPTELAITAEEQEKGLMGRTIPSIMSFVYSEPRVNSFWMHKTPLPLDLIFCQGNKIVAIHQGEPNSTKLIGGIVSDLVVELPQGTANKLGLQAGDPVKLQCHSHSPNTK